MDDRLAHTDQAYYLALLALGYGAIAQPDWVYNRPVNVAGLCLFTAISGIRDAGPADRTVLATLRA